MIHIFLESNSLLLFLVYFAPIFIIDTYTSSNTTPFIRHTQHLYNVDHDPTRITCFEYTQYDACIETVYVGLNGTCTTDGCGGSYKFLGDVYCAYLPPLEGNLARCVKESNLYNGYCMNRTVDVLEVCESIRVLELFSDVVDIPSLVFGSLTTLISMVLIVRSLHSLVLKYVVI